MSGSDPERLAPPSIDPNLIERAAVWIRAARGLIIAAGAGMGVDSGLPDFRGTEGFWKAYPPIAKLGIPFAQMANPGWFQRDPTFAWGFYGHRMNLYRQTLPHRGFALLQAWPQPKFVFTSNVDGHFHLAGFDPEAIVECHGSLRHLQCQSPSCTGDIWPADAVSLEINEETLHAAEPLPHCPACNRVARPNVLMFGDPYWIETRSAEQEARLDAWLQSHPCRDLAILEFGAGTAVPSVRMFCESIAARGAKLIRVNPREPEAPPGAIGIAAGAAATIAALDAEMRRAEGAAVNGG